VVILFAERKSKNEREIIEILKKYGADHISDSEIDRTKSRFTVVTVYKKTNLEIESGIAVYTDNTNRFKAQKHPIGVIGICEENNTSAFEIFKKSNNAVITCGANRKNTLTFSSANGNFLMMSLQRTIIDQNGNTIDPCELKIELTKNYSVFSVMVCAGILLLNGIKPLKF